MDIVNPKIDRYLDKHLTLQDPILREMQAYGENHNFPIVGPQIGRLLYLLARSVNAQRVLELGSGFGYSGMWFAKAVGGKGRVVLTDASKENAAKAHEYFRRAKMVDRVEIEVGDALKIIGGLPGQFDVVFNDVDKQYYPHTLDLVRTKLRVGGLFITDNMLWNGRVLSGSRSADVLGVKALTQQLLAADDFVTTILPVRDGLAVALRIR